MKINEDSILHFWRWFIKTENTIKECIENDHSIHRDTIVEQMNEHVLNLGVLTWDIGLNDDDNWFFMLSPNGNPDMLKVSQKIMDFAPEHMSWLFHSSKPAKNWNRQFSIYDTNMDEQFVDASEWQYIIFDDDAKFELIIEAKNISQLDPEESETAAEQFVIQEIGEATRILQISTITIVDAIESDFQSSKESVSELKDHLSEV